MPHRDFHPARSAKLRLAHIAVGTPVTRRPPHRSRRAVFPHRAPQIYSLPQSVQTSANPRIGVASDSSPCSLFPAGRLALLYPIRRVRAVFPLLAAYTCQPLPHVDGSPALGVLWADLTPCRSSASLLHVSVGIPVWPPTHGGFTFWASQCPLSAWADAHAPATPGTDRASQVPDTSLYACRALRWTPADPPEPHQGGSFV